MRIVLLNVQYCVELFVLGSPQRKNEPKEAIQWKSNNTLLPYMYDVMRYINNIKKNIINYRDINFVLARNEGWILRGILIAFTQHSPRPGFSLRSVPKKEFA
jgi:hypothetical protein